MTVDARVNRQRDSSFLVVGGCRFRDINEINFFKKQVIMLYEIYFIKHYYFSIINSNIILRLKLFKLTHGSST